MAAPSLGDFLFLDTLIGSGDMKAVCDFIKTKNITNEGYKNLNGDCNSPIYAAAREGQLDILKYFIAQGLDCQHRCEQSPLHVAAYKNHLDVVKWLIEEQGYDVTSVDRQGNTSLHEAVSEDNLDVVKYLVESGADVNHRNTYSGHTLLHTAVSYSHLEMCKYLLSNGFTEINAENDVGNTAVFLASMLGNVEMIYLLVDYGADVRIGNNKNMSPFWAATLHGYVDILQLFYSLGVDPEGEYLNGATPILTAAVNGHTNVVHYLAVVLNVSLKKTRSGHHSPLHAALEKENWDGAMMLLKAGAEIKDEDYRLLSESLDKCSDQKDFFSDLLFKPRSLTDMCCFTIRRILGRNINSSVDCLPLPCRLIGYVKLTHVVY